MIPPNPKSHLQPLESRHTGHSSPQIMIMAVVGSAKTAGVFHLRSPSGKYKMNFSQADAACKEEGATLASFKQLGYAQQVSPSVKT